MTFAVGRERDESCSLAGFGLFGPIIQMLLGFYSVFIFGRGS
jgi:hypothetical protein